MEVADAQSGRMSVGVLKKIRWSLEHRGAMQTVRSAAMSLKRRLKGPEVREPHPFDVRYGVDTDGLIAGSDLGVGHKNDLYIAGYAGAAPSLFLAAMDRWRRSGPAYPLDQYTFIDFGCGKGRVVLMASEMGFREVRGVELNDGLAKVAQANVAKWMAEGRAQSPIDVVCGDVTEFIWPDGPCLLYMYNPFGDTVMRCVVDQMHELFHARPDDLEVVYQKPGQAAVFEEWFETVWCEAPGLSEEDMRVDVAADPKDEIRAYRLRKG